MDKPKKFQVSSFKFHVLLLLSFTILLSLLMNGCARKTPEKLMMDAQEAYQQKDYTNAIIKLEDFLERFPNDPRAIQAQYGIAEIYAVQNRFPQAIQEYQKVINKYPVNSEISVRAKFNMANCYANMTTWDKAQEIWKKIAEDTTMPFAAIRAKFNMARFYEEMNELAKAEEIYKNILASLPLPKQFPKYANENITLDATQALAFLMLATKRTDKAISLLESLQNKYPDNEMAQGISINTNVQIGDIYLKTNQPKKARESYDKAIEQYAKITADKIVPNKAAWATMRMGEVYELHLKDTTQAAKLYQDVIKNYSRSDSVFYAKNAMMRMSKPPMAQDTTKKVAVPVTPSVDTTQKKKPAK